MTSKAETAAFARRGQDRAQPRAIATWLLAVAAMVFLMVVVGGITRLTESGLSITQWKPVSGAIPPLTHGDWVHQFDLYKQTPQYRIMNRSMTLDDFQFIFFWEYIHRLLGRLIGVVFAIPFLWFAIRRAIPRGYGWRLGALLALGGLQGAIGWWMVTSGLVARTEVSHIRLAVHLLTALFIFGGLIWTALDLRALAHDPRARPARFTAFAALVLAILFIQLMLGAFTAGLRAGYAFASWPLMGDTLFPSATPMLAPFWHNLVDNPVVVQFVHRWWAFLAAALIVWLALRSRARGGARVSAILIGLVILQILLGISTLLSGVDLWIAVAHQAGGALLVAFEVANAHVIGRRTPVSS